MEPSISSELTIQDLYDLFETKLHRYAVNLARDHDRADDLVQETRESGRWETSCCCSN